MNSRRLILFLAITFAVGCDRTPQLPDGVRQNYPGIIRDSPERREKAEREWRRMLDAYNVQQTPPDLYPIVYTPRSLLGVSDGIKIMAERPAQGSEEIALRAAVKGFIDRWRDLVGTDPTVVSLVSEDRAGTSRRLIYRQSNYPYPVVGDYGRMTAIISEDGRLMQLDDTFIPTVELPLRPQLDRQAAAQRVQGRTFTYSDIAGREQRVQINSPEEITVNQIVVLPVERNGAIEVHLAWEVVAGSSLSWTVYLDAMDGQELQTRQNFNT